MPVAAPSDTAELQARLAAALAERDAAVAACDNALSRNDRPSHLLRQLQRMQFAPAFREVSIGAQNWFIAIIGDGSRICRYRAGA